jgi:UDP-glucose 4-epimerase
MKVLVTGGAGYIGSHTVAELVEAGYDTVVFDNLSKGHKAAVLGGEFVRGDLCTDTELLDGTLKKNKIDAVVHFAADSLVGESMKDPGKYFRNNVIAGINLMNAAVKNSVKKMIFSSTAAVYGDPEKVPIDETNNKVPTNAYGESKLLIERMLRWYDYAYGFKYVSLRYFNAAGAHSSGRIGEDHNPESHLIPIILKSVIDGKKEVSVFGADYPTKDGTCVRDYIHVSDLALAHILALKKLEKGGASSIYNLGNGEGFSVKEVIEVAEKVTGCGIKQLRSPRRQGDPAVLIASSDKIRKELGWNPKYFRLELIVESAWKWHKEHPGGFVE